MKWGAPECRMRLESCRYSHFICKETEVQREEGICWGCHSWVATLPGGFTPRRLDAVCRQRTRDERSEWEPHRGEGESKSTRSHAHCSFTHRLERIPCMWQLKIFFFPGKEGEKQKPRKPRDKDGKEKYWRGYADTSHMYLWILLPLPPGAYLRSITSKRIKGREWILRREVMSRKRGSSKFRAESKVH